MTRRALGRRKMYSNAGASSVLCSAPVLLLFGMCMLGVWVVWHAESSWETKRELCMKDATCIETSDEASPRTLFSAFTQDQHKSWMRFHDVLIADARRRQGVKTLFIGDSITEAFRGTSYGKPCDSGLRPVPKKRWMSKHKRRQHAKARATARSANNKKTCRTDGIPETMKELFGDDWLALAISGACQRTAVVTIPCNIACAINRAVRSSFVACLIL